MTGYFAVLQVGGPIYGVGTDQLGAIDAAAEWLDDGNEGGIDPVWYTQAPTGAIAIGACTEALYDYQMTHSLPYDYEERDSGVLDIVRS